KAAHWLGVLTEIGLRRQNESSVEVFRAHLLRATWFLLHSPARIDEAQREIEKAKRLSKTDSRHLLALRGLDPIDIRLVEGLVIVARNRSHKVGAEEVASHFEPLVRDARRDGNKVLEAEALLRWSGAEACSGRTPQAQELLRDWD